jgi:hypothetical protein
VTSPSSWIPLDFEDRIARWIDRDGFRDDDLRLEVVSWIINQLHDPYDGVKPVASLPGLYQGTIPHTEIRGTAVLCSYWIDNDARTVRCDNIATLALPH